MAKINFGLLPLTFIEKNTTSGAIGTKIASGVKLVIGAMYKGTDNVWYSFSSFYVNTSNELWTHITDTNIQGQPVRFYYIPN